MLILYKNIRDRRKELKMSQQELAEKTGYTDRSSIAKIESGKVDLTQSKIKAIADALQTTSSALMGELPRKNENSPSIADYDDLYLIHNIIADLNQSAANTYSINGSQGKGSVTVHTDIPKDKYALVGEGEILKIKQTEYKVLKNVLKAIKSE